MKRLGFLFLIVLLLIPAVSGSKQRSGEDTLVPVQIKRMLLINESPAVLLVDRPEKEFLLVFIDYFMANAIRLGMDESVLERPLTHDLIGIFLRRLGAKLVRIDITKLKNNTYYALITLDVNGQKQQIDARPSDALAIAVRNKTPIYANRALLKSLEKMGEKEGPERQPIPPFPEQKPKAST